MGLLNLLIQGSADVSSAGDPAALFHYHPRTGPGWVASLMGGSHGQIYGPADAQSTQASRSHRHGDAVHLRFRLAKPVPVNMSLIRNTRLGTHLGLFRGDYRQPAVRLCGRPAASPALSVLSGIDRTAALLSCADQHHARLVQSHPDSAARRIEDRHGFLPERAGYVLARLEPYGFFVIIGLLYLGALGPIIHFFRWVITSLIGLLLF